MKGSGHTGTFVLALAASLVAGPVQAQPTQLSAPDQAAIARALLGPDAKQRSDAFTAAARMDPASIEHELRIALIALLQSEADAGTARAVAGREGRRQLPPPNGGEFIGGVASVVASLQDPRAIPALASALGTGYTAINALVGFGEAAAPAVLEVAASPESFTSAVNHAVKTLELMVDSAPVRPLSPATLIAAERVAERRLTEPQRSITTTWAALDLAARFQNPKLRAVIESIATDPAQATARGAWDTGIVEQTRKRAADALARQARPLSPGNPRR